MKTALIVALVIISLILIVLVFLQPSKTNGLSGFVGGGAGDTYYSKNKTKTYEGMLSRLTVIFAILFALVVIALNKV
ncbi:preprotein translocase subunit SecG [Clostridium sp. USBA 49]|jgi:preprotein translocase subunit SecG|uniref:preprotein translocase subunit SecG n=1 Tax=Clostridium TaxID=1485 RepID=UPI00099B1558|nr:MULTISPECIES: preprotein translocase subunit SecG [Clostridium]SKA73052.1 preprotein translocase subunit SecG [Clostridium sp. USBA 49]